MAKVLFKTVEGEWEYREVEDLNDYQTIQGLVGGRFEDMTPYFKGLDGKSLLGPFFLIGNEIGSLNGSPLNCWATAPIAHGAKDGRLPLYGDLVLTRTRGSNLTAVRDGDLEIVRELPAWKEPDAETLRRAAEMKAAWEQQMAAGGFKIIGRR